MSKKTKILSAIIAAILIITATLLLLFLWSVQNLSSTDLNIPKKYIFLGIAILFLFVTWSFLSRKKLFTKRVVYSRPKSGTPWHKDWYMVRFGYVTLFVVVALFGAYIIPKIKAANAKWSNGGLGKELFQSDKKVSYTASNPTRLTPQKNIVMHAGVEYGWLRECDTMYYFDLANPGDAVITIRSKDYPEQFIRKKLVNENGYRYEKLLSGKDPMIAGEYIVTVNQKTSINLRQYKVK